MLTNQFFETKKIKRFDNRSVWRSVSPQALRVIAEREEKRLAIFLRGCFFRQMRSCVPTAHNIFKNRRIRKEILRKKDEIPDRTVFGDREKARKLTADFGKIKGNTPRKSPFKAFSQFPQMFLTKGKRPQK